MYEQNREKFNSIINGVIKDREKGLEQFYNEYGKLIFLTAKASGCDEYQANSVVNNVLLKIWRKANRLFDIRNPIGWIYIVTKNCAKDELNEKWNLELKENICSTEDAYEKVCSEDSFEYLLTPLNEKEKDIVSLKSSGKTTFRDIAEIHDKPVPTITSLFYRALEKIKKFIKDNNLE